MARVKGAMMTRKRRNKTLKLAKGYWGNKSRHFKMANEQVMKSLTYAYVGRRLKKRDFRSLWITRISAACATARQRLKIKDDGATPLYAGTWSGTCAWETAKRISLSPSMAYSPIFWII